MLRKDDYAILVGVADYPGAGFAHLEGPPNDVALLRRWLTAADGGDMPEANVREIVSPQPAPEPRPTRYPPTKEDVWDVLGSIVFDANQRIIQRLNGRLYLLFSGHGFSNFSEDLNHAALYTANGHRNAPFNVCGTKMAAWCANAAAFGEIILVMDCCRDQEISALADEPEFRRTYDPKSKGVKRLEVYAVPYDGKAQERPFNVEDERKVHGILTYAFVRALQCAPLIDGKRTSYAVKTFLEGGWGSIVGADRVEAPEFVLPKRGDIVFSVSEPRSLPVHFVFSPPLAETASLSVRDGSQAPVLEVKLDPTAKQSVVQHVVTGVFEQPTAFDGTGVSLELKAGIYEAMLARAGKPDVSTFVSSLGDQDAILQL